MARRILPCASLALALGGCVLPEAERDSSADGGAPVRTDAAAPMSAVPEPAAPTEHVFAEWPMPDALPGSQTQPSYSATDLVTTDKVTGLRWQGRPPDIYPSCTGKYRVDDKAGTGCTWAEAVAYCRSSDVAFALGGGIWRLPTKVELESILDETRSFAAPAVFDTYPIDFFWSATPYIKLTTTGNQLAFAVDFAEGWSYCTGLFKAGRVRCVTSASETGGSEPQYSIEDEVVTDERTHLHWQRSVAPDEHTFADAKVYCAALDVAGGGWRAPAYKELLTLVDPRRRDPTIDVDAFPDTPQSVFWTASPYLDENVAAYQVDFRDGQSTRDGSVNDLHHVRCVR